MTELNWNNQHDIILQYESLEKHQGLKIYFKTLNSNNEIVILSQIIPYGFSVFYSNEVPIQAHGAMKNYTSGVQTIGWEIHDERFEVNLKHITKIEIVDNAIDEILKEMED